MKSSLTTRATESASRTKRKREDSPYLSDSNRSGLGRRRAECGGPSSSTHQIRSAAAEGDDPGLDRHRSKVSEGGFVGGKDDPVAELPLVSLDAEGRGVVSGGGSVGETADPLGQLPLLSLSSEGRSGGAGVDDASPDGDVGVGNDEALTGDFMKETSSVSANNLLACLYVDAMVRLVRDSLGSEEFVLVLPALRPLGSADALPSSKWHTKGLFREVCPAEAMRLVDRLSSRIPVGGGWDQIAGVWAELDVCAEVTAVRDRSGGSVPMSGSHTMSVMKRTLKEEAGLALATKDHPLTSFEVARLFVGLFHLGWRHGHSDRTLWVRLAFSEELGFRKRRCSKDLSGAVSGQHRARWATHVLECIGELTDTLEELAGSSWPSDAGLRQAEELLAGNESSKVWEKFQEAVTAEPGSLFKRTSWGLRSQEVRLLVWG
eukprot:g15867.t2